MKAIHIYTDGACRGNPGAGGWAAVLIYEGHRKTLRGGDKNTTNNRMELTAAIQALAAIKQKKLKGQKHVICITTDSRYLKDGIEIWLADWKKNNWRTAQKRAVKNRDLWMKLDRLNSLYDIRWQWVRGHSGHPMNELADQLAKESIP